MVEVIRAGQKRGMQPRASFPAAATLRVVIPEVCEHEAAATVFFRPRAGKERG